MLVSTEDENVSDNLKGWGPISMSEYQIEIQLDFRDPLYVSEGEILDNLVLIVTMGDFYDEDGQTLSKVLPLQKPVPRQIGSKTEAEIFEAVGSSAQNVAGGSIGVGFILTLFFSVSLS